MSIIKKRLITLFFALILLGPFIFTPVYAQENSTDSVVILEKNTVVERDYFASGGSISLHGTVNGDAYLFGGNVTVDGLVNGDLIVFGGTVNVNGEIKNDLRIAGGTVVINGKINGNILAGGGSITLAKNSTVGGSLIVGGGMVSVNTPISKNVWIGSGQTIINSELKTDVNIGGGEITLDADARVGGNLNYWSDQEIKLLQGASVAGVVVRQENLKSLDKDRLTPFFSGASLVFKIVSTFSLLIIGLLLLRFFPKKTLQVSVEIDKNPLPSFGWGIGLSIILGVLSFILVVSLFGLPLGLLTGVILAIELYLSVIFISLWLGRRVFTGLDNPKRYSWALVVGLFLFQLLSVVPFIGGLLKLIGVLVSFGALARVKRDSYLELKSKL